MKKIIASILAIAMVASMFTMVLSANTAEKTNYSEYVDVLNDLVDELLNVGPQMLDEAVLFDANNTTYANNDSNRRIALAGALGGSGWTATVFGELARFDERFEEIGDYYDDLEDYEDALEDYEEGKIVGLAPVAPVYPYGVATDKLISDEAAFIAELSESAAMDAVAQAWGYDSFAEAIDSLYYKGGHIDDADLTVATRTPRVKDWKSELPAEIVSKYIDKDNKWAKDENGSRTASYEAVLEWVLANKPELLPSGSFEEMDVEYMDTHVAFDMLMAYVVSAVRFGENADAEWFAPEFNANRVAVYKTAIQAAKDFITALRHQVTSWNNCPYADELAAYMYFADLVNDVDAYGNEAVYNESYGINPYPVVNLENAYGIDAYVGILGGYQWFTFADIAAHSELAAQLLTELQAQLRAAALFNPTGVLYAEFEGKLEELVETFEALCWELVVGGKNAPAAKDYSYNKEIFAAVVELLQVEALYTYYIEDFIPLYAQSVENISILYNLYGQIEYARAILEHVGYSDDADYGFWWSFIYDFDKGSGADTDDLGYWIDDDDLDRTLKFKNGFKFFRGMSAEAIRTFVDNIEANIAALAPAAGQKITAAELAKGQALYNKAGNLISYYANQVDDEGQNLIPSYNWLVAMYTELGNYMPAADGVATAELPIDIYYLPLFDVNNGVALTYGLTGTWGQYDSHELDATEYAYTLEFAPVAYVYLSLLPEVEAAIEAVEFEVTKLSTEGPEFGIFPVEELFATMQKYDFLTMRDMVEDGDKLDDEDTRLYFMMLTGFSTEEAFFDTSADEDVADVEFGAGSFLALTMGDPVGETDLAYDYAVRNYANFYAVFDLIRSGYATEWDTFGDYYDYVDGDKIDFSGDFSILDVTVKTNEALLKELIAELEAAAALLCVNVTDRIAMFAWVNAELAEIFELDLDNATYSVSDAATGYGVAANYVEGELKNLAKAMTALNQLIDRYYEVKINGKWVPIADRATPAKLEAAFDAVKTAFYKLLTAKGAACADVYFAQIELTLAARVYGNKNSVDDVQTALNDHVRGLNMYFPGEAEMRPYEYFAWTLRTVANYNERANIYRLADGSFNISFYNKFAKAVAGVNAIVTGQYPSAVREDAAKLAFFANDIYDGIAAGAFPAKDEEGYNWNAYNMPLWYALELSQYLAEYVATAAGQHASALQAVKDEVLAPVVAEAETIMTAFLVKPMPIVIDYNAAQNVMANSKNGTLYIYSAEEIQAAADALAAEVELAKAELGEAVYTVEDVLALIDAAVATTEARATGMAADLKDLRVAANEAKTEIAAGAFNQNTYVANVVSAANAALKALVDVKLADKTLYTPASYEAYEAAYNTLMDVVDINAEVELTVAEALAAVKAAEAELVLIADATGAMYEAAKAAYEAALTVDGTKYTADSFAAFTAAVEALKAAIDNYASDVDLQAAIVNVKVAEVQLVAAPIDEVGTLDD